MKAIDIKEGDIRKIIILTFDNYQYVQNGVVFVGFVAGRIVHCSYCDTMTFEMPTPDLSGYQELYKRVNAAIKVVFPDAKIIDAKNFNDFSENGLSIKF